MPIRGLTEKTEDGSPMRLRLMGRIFKGDEKPKDGNRPGADLDYFRFEPEPGFEHVALAWEELYGDKPKQLSNVWLADASAEAAFTTWREEWTGGGALLHRCTGTVDPKKPGYQTHWYNPESGMNMTARVDCVHASVPNAPGCGCVPVGRLRMLLPDLMTAASEIGAVMLTTHSINDIMDIASYLDELERLGHVVNRVPFHIWRAPKQITRPATSKEIAQAGGKAVKKHTTKNLVHIKAMPEYVQARISASVTDAPMLQERAGVTTASAKALLGSGPQRLNVGTDDYTPEEGDYEESDGPYDTGPGQAIDDDQKDGWFVPEGFEVFWADYIVLQPMKKGKQTGFAYILKGVPESNPVPGETVGIWMPDSTKLAAAGYNMDEYKSMGVGHYPLDISARVVARLVGEGEKSTWEVYGIHQVSIPF